MTEYHDQEWGVPLHDEQRHFEFLLLEFMQAGLSWRIILQKREHLRRRFCGFDCRKTAAFGEAEIQSLLADPSIIRNRRKIEAAISNARAFMDIQEAFGSFDSYIWGFTGGASIDHELAESSQMPTTDPLAESVSRDLRSRGFRFIGPTIIYAHLQAIGIILDHETACFRYRQIREEHPDHHWIRGSASKSRE